MICGSPLVYTERAETRRCEYCGERQTANAACEKGHFICDRCHGAEAFELIQRVCSATESRTPLALASTLMRDPRVAMHGPEHHFLVPAVLLACYANTTGQDASRRAQWVSTARARAEEVKGGACGFSGACGAGVGTGIFVSVALGATPLSREEWRLANLITSESLQDIAMRGGPRCCKRDTFTAIERAVRFVAREMGTEMDAEDRPRCRFHPMNHECLRRECRYFPGPEGSPGG